MTEPLKDSIVLITGAGSGIGRALAQEASRHGHRLILVGRRPGPLQDTADLLARPDTLCLSADIATAEGRAAIVAAVALAGGLDILINNAGSVASGPISAVGDAELEQLIRTNVIAPIALSRELLPFLAERHGQVVNVGSVFGDIAFPFFGLYSTSKFAMRGFSEAMRRELAPKGIAVTYLAPRGTKTGAARPQPVSQNRRAVLRRPATAVSGADRPCADETRRRSEGGDRRDAARLNERNFNVLQYPSPGGFRRRAER